MPYQVVLYWFFLGSSIVSAAHADDWASFRGSTGNGAAIQATLPTNWTQDDICWKTELPGYGWSQPIVFGETVYLTAAVSEQLKPPKNMMAGVVDPSTIAAGKLRAPDIEIDWQVIAVSLASGAIQWTHSATIGKPKFPVHASNSFATETCCADAHGVYAYFGATGTVVAVDHQGHERWRAELGAHKTVQGFGSGASPAISNGILAVTCFNDEASYVVGFETKTGKEVWRKQWSEKTLPLGDRR
ncbi:MAG: PQQ-binding-like beta-propeller repeat protein [Pirellula sp.]